PDVPVALQTGTLADLDQVVQGDIDLVDVLEDLDEPPRGLRDRVDDIRGARGADGDPARTGDQIAPRGDRGRIAHDHAGSVVGVLAVAVRAAERRLVLGGGAVDDAARPGLHAGPGRVFGEGVRGGDGHRPGETPH